MITEVERIAELFSFPLDSFQINALQALQDGHSVIVCAPTGSGKTVVAEAAVHMALSRQKRVFYTTPLKALSNQKFHDLSANLGEDHVGLLTGDISIRRDASVVVMTTEVFRNMLYGTTLGDVAENLRDVQFVVLDECHYMNDPERGTVWEESIIYAPKGVQMVALSATVANAGELREWMDVMHGTTTLIVDERRPVPLRHYYFGEGRLHRLLSPRGDINPKLKGQFRTPQHSRARLHRPAPSQVLSSLSHKDMLPAIYFLFSRRGCEEALQSCRGLHLGAREQVRAAVDDALRENPSLEQYPFLDALYDGLAVHHAGLLPSWKRLIETLFAKGYIQVVFATDTLAAGINMPARTTVISAITRRTGEGFRTLTASEFLQASGRAGRRGMDELGFVVVLQREFETPEQVVRLATSPPDPLVSQFTPNYGMVLNLLQRHTMATAADLIGRSFGQFLADRRLKPVLDELEEVVANQKELEQPLCPGERGDLGRYKKWNESIQNQKRQMKAIRGHGHGVEMARNALRQRAEAIQAQMQAFPCHKCPVQGPCDKQGHRKHRLSLRRSELERDVQRYSAPYWDQFTRLVDVLRVAGYMEGDRPTAAGCLAASLRATNVLFMAEVARQHVLEQLPMSAAAAVLAALVTDEEREPTAVRARLSPDAVDGLADVSDVARRVNRWQRHHDVTIPVAYNATFGPLVEAWVQGADWEEIRAMTYVDEGDVVRNLRRTLDLCRQFIHAPGMPDRVVRKCREVEMELDRDEVQEPLI